MLRPLSARNPLSETAPRCCHCGAPVVPEVGRPYLRCSSCESALHLSPEGLVLHHAVARTLDPAQVEGALRRWMSGNATARHLDRDAVLVSNRFQWFPMWYFRVGSGREEQVHLEPAAPTAVSDLAEMSLPAGKLLPWSPDHEAESLPPEIPRETALSWVGGGVGEVREQALVHVPIHVCRYEWGGRTWTAVVDAASGAVYANLFPVRWELPYALVTLVVGGTYLALSWIPASGLLLGMDDLGVGLVGSALTTGAWACVASAVGLPLMLVAGVVAVRA